MVINSLKKYLFGLIVTAYVISAVGIPIYLHYCGGELAKINYVLKSSSCCDGEEDDSIPEDDGCCKDENVFLKNNTDFTIKHSDFELAKTISQVPYISLPYSYLIPSYNLWDMYVPPYTQPDLQQEAVVSTSVLRI